MGLPIIPQGADEVIQITLTDSSGSPINPNDLQDVIVSVYQTKEDIIQQWKLSDNDVVISGDGSTGIVTVAMDRDNTRSLPEKRLYIEVCIESENASFENNTQRQIASDIPLADLINTVTE